MRKIGVLYAGAFFHFRAFSEGKFAQFIHQIIYLPELTPQDLKDLDILWVPSQLPLNLLDRHQATIRAFAASGGIVVAMGPQPNDLIPNTAWIDRETNFWWWLDSSQSSGLKLDTPDYPLFDYITLADATWHQHGFFKPLNQVTSLISKENEGTIFYLDKTPEFGTWLVTCLDPEYHFGSYFMPATEKFLEGFLPWLAYGEI
ncbi:hypothetical protein [Pseudolactococcus reticulitermitis]|uniref:Glutamine amidotransferase domain-containing protein n=1 Tax=Pseudolactococcus reticulitermitis TaxID=2025039 RepID=A0A224X8Z0_9LACT|nr:hypothetical protein [Lactococcus reticulitermitis]GAX46472.1 hypothetical protein RsY01_51 [Lactococcus reticulitermitis]